MTDRIYFETFIPWEFGHIEKSPYCGLTHGQPLLLVIFGRAVNVADLHNVAVGALEPVGAAKVRALSQQGYLLLARVNGPCHCIQRNVIVWSDGKESIEKDETVTTIVRDVWKLPEGPMRIKVPVTD